MEEQEDVHAMSTKEDWIVVENAVCSMSVCLSLFILPGSGSHLTRVFAEKSCVQEDISLPFLRLRSHGGL